MNLQLEIKKREFLETYNSKRSVVEALSCGINASVQRNNLYAVIGPSALKNKAIDFWRTELLRISKLKLTPNDVTKYEEQIINLKSDMNNRFADCFEQSLDRNEPPGFRISHAQKSIAVFLKHLWCMKEIGTPPQCPVDRIILTKAGYINEGESWTRINTIQEHRRCIRFLTQKAKIKEMELAEWELMNFKYKK